MGSIAFQITSLTIVYFVYSGADQRKHQSSTSLAIVREFTGDRVVFVQQVEVVLPRII